MRKIVVYLYFIKHIIQWIDCYLRIGFDGMKVNIELVSTRGNDEHGYIRVWLGSKKESRCSISMFGWKSNEKDEFQSGKLRYKWWILKTSREMLHGCQNKTCSQELFEEGFSANPWRADHGVDCDAIRSRRVFSSNGSLRYRPCLFSSFNGARPPSSDGSSITMAESGGVWHCRAPV